MYFGGRDTVFWGGGTGDRIAGGRGNAALREHYIHPSDPGPRFPVNKSEFLLDNEQPDAEI